MPEAILDSGGGVGSAYEASHIKRQRATAQEVKNRRARLLDIVYLGKPMTVRQVFYQASVRSIVEKTEAGYAKVQTDLVWLRRAGQLPYGWLADNTRWQRRPHTFDSPQEALKNTAKLYRKALWSETDTYVEIWLEKDALAGVVLPITDMYDTPLMVTRGYASLSFLHSAAEYIGELADVGIHTHIYHFGDYDPSGVNAAEKIEQTLREMAPNAEISFERVAVTKRQIQEMNLPSRPTKTTDSRSKGFGDVSVELDAIEPAQLRHMVEEVIQRHLPPAEFEVLKAAEASERKLIAGLVGMLADGVHG